ncbi:MAG: thiosulfate oxidation carrier protein SoxY [Pseudomonadota bacterium]
MHLSRRRLLQLSAGGSLATALKVAPAGAAVRAEKTQAAIDAFTDGATLSEGRVNLITPEIAENGNTVPIEFSVDSAMSDDDYVAEVMVLADGNPNPGVATFKFKPINGSASAKTRIRLAKTQDVLALAKMSDGSVHLASRNVKVTIGGCGG